MTTAFTLPTLCAQDAKEKARPASKSLLDLFFAGGPLMYPILLCSIGTIAVATYCGIQFRERKMMPKSQTDRTIVFMKQRDAGAAYDALDRKNTAFARCMKAALLKVNFERDLANKPSMEQAAAEKIIKEETLQMRWVNYLNTFATIAPMLGLLGTVQGMIEAFDQLAAGQAEPQDLANGIGVAMITTAGGLIVGIPAMFGYFFFRNQLITIIANMQEKVTFSIDLLTGELKVQGATEDANPSPEVSEVMAEPTAQYQ
jgi:biopolymer transport protein ExbB